MKHTRGVLVMENTGGKKDGACDDAYALRLATWRAAAGEPIRAFADSLISGVINRRHVPAKKPKKLP